jgi:hypothetical protein
MSKLGSNAKKIWDSRKDILNGIKNSIFVSDAVEIIAEERKVICLNCPLIDLKGDKCTMPGTHPCCGSCGCSLKFKLRSLSSGCPEDNWEPVLTEEEELDHDILNPNAEDDA